MKLFFRLSIVTLALLLSSAPMADAKVKSKRRATTQKAQQAKLPANINELMQAPYITPNKDGFINRRNAPQSNANVKATTTVKEDDNDVLIKIYVKGKLVQNLTAYYNFPFGFFIYYLDFNYDGYTDIFVVSNEEPYGGAALLLWNPNLKKFEMKNDCAQSFSLHPLSKTISFYSCSMACMGEHHYEKCVFRNNKFEVIDELVEFPCDDGRTYYYMGLGCYNKIDFSKEYENPKGLSINSVSQEWKNIMNSFK